MRHKKKPITVEVVHLQPTEKSIREALEFMGYVIDISTKEASDRFSKYCSDIIKKELKINAGGTMTASVGDYIIKDAQGEFYSCEPDTFGLIYELGEGNTPTKVKKDDKGCYVQRGNGKKYYYECNNACAQFFVVRKMNEQAIKAKEGAE